MAVRVKPSLVGAAYAPMVGWFLNKSAPKPFWYTAGALYDRQKAHPGESITDSLDAMALNAKPKKVSNMIHARELDITADTTVSDLFELIDLPCRIAKNAKVGLVGRGPDLGSATYRLRIEWTGDDA